MPGEMEVDQLQEKTLRNRRQGVDNANENPPGMIESIRRYPKGVFFILGNEFCERFSYYGMRVVLMLYFLHVHGHSNTQAKLFYHLFTVICYFTPLIGSIIADGCIGKFRTILYGSIIYCIGHILLTCGSIPGLDRTMLLVLDFSGLFVIATATGAIKPCVAAFAADQFPSHMAYEREAFFGFFYFAINMGSLVSDIVNPILRGGVSCFGHDECFPLAFGLPAILMFLATVIFLCGKPFYGKERTIDRNIILEVVNVYACALRGKMSNLCSGNQKEHWLDYAEGKCDHSLIVDVKQLSRMVIIFVPTIFFWALFDQQGSTWIIQAESMDGNVGRMTILPEQLGVLNPFLIVTLIPIMTAWVYPCFHRYKILDRPLKRMCAGGMLAALSFVIAGFLQLSVNKSLLPAMEPGYTQAYVANTLACDLTIGEHKAENQLFQPFAIKNLSASLSSMVCGGQQVEIRNSSTIDGMKATVLTLNSDEEKPIAFIHQFPFQKSKKGQTTFMFIPGYTETKNLTVVPMQGDMLGTMGKESVDRFGPEKAFLHLKPSIFGSKHFDFYLKGEGTKDMILKRDVKAWMGSVQAVFVLGNNPADEVWHETLIKGNSVSLLWQVPQYFVMTVGEILLSVTGLEFAYAEGPPALKSVLLACWLLANAFGNVLAMIISGSDLITEPHDEFFFYAAMMFVVMIVFAVVGRGYRYKADATTQGIDAPFHSASDENKVTEETGL